MQDAQKYLEIVSERGKRRLELQRVYHNLQSRELFLLAYGKLYANKGATTPGTDPEDTVDGMSIQRIDKILADLKAGTYKWKPVRRTYIPKKNGDLRPLGVPSWNDKLLQQVMQMILTAYYEPQFSEHSHGFRPGRSTHTALAEIMDNWKGTKWFVEGDIKGCFDNISHQKLLEIIGRSIHDNRFLKLLKGMLEAGYLEDWRYNQTYSGTPQGGVISPLLSNIFLNELDKYVEKEIVPAYNRGTTRRTNPEYAALLKWRRKAKDEGDIKAYKMLGKEQVKIPYGMADDSKYRRLKYVRYADDFLIGFIGPLSEAEQVKAKIGEYLESIELTMSQEKTLITHATEQSAKFLGYELSMGKSDSRKRSGRRTINGTPLFRVPEKVVSSWTQKRMRSGKPYHRQELTNLSDYEIVTIYRAEFQGLANYYTMAYNVAQAMYEIKYVYKQSLVKTLAVKHKTSASSIYKKYYKKLGNGIQAIVVTVEREGKKPLVAVFGAKPILYSKVIGRVDDALTQPRPQRNELIKRVTAEICELCGSEGSVETHHIRKLADLKKRYMGRNQPPMWVTRMIGWRRKTLVVCEDCHLKIHSGTYHGTRLRR
jgi:group II intron reverse transcriptase/maturase